MPKVHLTPQTIKSLEAIKGKRTEYYDDHLIKDGKLKARGVKGLVLRVSPAGSKTFYYRYRYNKSAKRLKLGSFPTLSLSAARNKVRDELAPMVADGIDPARVRKDRETESPTTVAEYVDQFKNGYMKRRLKVSTFKTYSSRLNKVKNDTKLSSLYLKDVTRADVRRFLKTESKENPTNANRLHSILSKLFNEALEDGLIKENPIKKMPKLNTENEREPQYESDQIKDIWEAMGEEHISMEGLLKMLLITGQRLGETSRMKWDDVNGNLWTIPKAQTKTDSTHKVHLSNLALNVLKKVQTLNGSSEYVFASIQDYNKPFSFFHNATERIRKQTGLDDFRIHDLRHIVATYMIDKCHVEFVHVGKVLNHKGLSGGYVVTSRYTNSDFSEQKKQALEAWGNYLRAIVSDLESLSEKAG